jgi:carbohydrate-binding DOMON domain-containing protein
MKRSLALTAALVVLAAGASFAAEFTDPKGDDNGPGTYVYPTDIVYTAGSFDLTAFEVTAKKNKVEFDVEMAASLDDPWRMETGFAIQMIFIFIDTDGKEGSGHTDSLPGLNIQFDPKHAWDRCVILSPQSSSRVQQEVRTKAAAMQDSVVVPRRVSGSGKSIGASVKLEDLGEGDPETCGYQVVVQSNEGFPAKGDLLTRKVNEFEGQHRFGGGTDYDCDPHVMDILAGEAVGAPEEVELQHEMLAYECDDEGNATKMATLKMVRK